MPRAMYFYDRFPFWQAFFRHLGFRQVLSKRTNKQVANLGVDSVVAEPCFPIQVAHGHVRALLDEGVDYVFIPNMINAETEFPEVNSHVCPWGQTLPFVVQHAPMMEGYEEKLLKPTISFREGMEYVKRELRPLARRFKISARRCDEAVEAGYEAQQSFNAALQEAGERAMTTLEERQAFGIVMVGRPYNIYDSGINIDIPGKLRDYYGVNVIPFDFLPLHGVDIGTINDNMYWNYGRKILQAARIISQHEYLHIIYITNFKCGPDSYIKHFVRDAAGKPFLTLQFDGHSNDAGIITRCEAYLDSKGFLRWWKRGVSQMAPSSAPLELKVRQRV